jgi:hypothetical protein
VDSLGRTLESVPKDHRDLAIKSIGKRTHLHNLEFHFLRVARSNGVTHFDDGYRKSKSRLLSLLIAVDVFPVYV